MLRRRIRTLLDRRAVSFKLRRIYVPLLGLSVGLTVFYSLLNWIFVQEIELFPLDEELVALWIPLAVSVILWLIMLRPRIKLLRFSEAGGFRELYQLLAIAFLAAPLIAAQSYLETASGSVTHVQRLQDVASIPRSKFYFVDDVCVDYNSALVTAHVETPHGRNSSTSFYLYAAAPLCDQTLAHATERPVKIGLKFHTEIGKAMTAAELQASYREFVKSSQLQIDQESPRLYQYFERVGRNTDRRGFYAALRTGPDTGSGSPIVLIPHKDRFDQRNGDKPFWLAASYVVGAIVWLGLILFRPLDHPKLALRSDGIDAKPRRDLRWVAGFLVPSRKSYGLPILLDLNIGVFLAMALSGLGVVTFWPQDLLAWGAAYRPAIHGWGAFRLVASQFIHLGLWHLVSNLYGLFFACLFLAPATSNARLIACYLVCGLAGSTASVLAHPATISVGASGAIFGLWGILLVLLLVGDHRFVGIRQLALVYAAILVGLNLVLGAFMPGIDAAAHAGGLIAGIGLGTAIFLSHRARSPGSPSEPDNTG